MISANDARIKTKNKATYRLFIDRINTYIEGGITLGRYTVDIANRILDDNDDLITVPYEVMDLALKELEKSGYKARITNDKEILHISWEE